MKAFPQKYPLDPLKPYVSESNPLDGGMDLRDYFAAKAMESDIANWSIEAEKTRETNFWGYEEIAKRAYTMADAMMEARKQ